MGLPSGRHRRTCSSGTAGSLGVQSFDGENYRKPNVAVDFASIATAGAFYGADAEQRPCCEQHRQETHWLHSEVLIRAVGVRIRAGL